MQTDATRPRDLCYRIHQVCKGEFEVLSARPWNKFDPTESLWWLIPSTEWPAYKYAKLYFEWAAPDHSGISCGLHMEKGLDPSVQSAYPSKKGSSLIMRKDWAWHPFLADLEQGAITKALRNAIGAAGKDFVLKVEGGFVRNPGETDPYSPEFRKTKAVYRFACGNSLETLALLHAVDPAKLMGSLKTTDSFPKLAAEIKSLMSNGFLWIDVWLGLSLDIRKGGEVISDAELWRKHLRHFAGWL